MARKKDDWFRSIYPDSLRPLCNYLRRFLGSAEAAEDVAHDAFLRVYTAPDFARIRSPRSYLFRTARNLALNVVNQHDVAKTQGVEEVERFADEDPSVERQVMTSEEFDMLCIAVGRLPSQRRRVLTLRAIYGYSCREIANHLGVSTRTVNRDLAAALEAVHAARAAIEADEASLYAQVIALRRGEEPPA